MLHSTNQQVFHKYVVSSLLLKCLCGLDWVCGP